MLYLQMNDAECKAYLNLEVYEARDSTADLMAVMETVSFLLLASV